MSSQLIGVSCSYKRVPHGSIVLPNVISGSLARYGESQECPVEALNLTVPLGMKGGSARMFHTAQLLELSMNVIFKFSSLIMVNSEQKTKPENKIIVEFLGNCLS